MGLPGAKVMFLGDEDEPPRHFKVWLVEFDDMIFQIEKTRHHRWYNIRWSVGKRVMDEHVGETLGNTLHIINIMREIVLRQQARGDW